MVEKSSIGKSLQPRLLNIPNEILFEIISTFSISDIRRLRVCRQLSYFVQDYFNKYLYNKGIARLPGELVLNIVRQLPSQHDRSHLAQASQRLYSLTTGHIARYDVQHGSCLMVYAARQNLKGMAKKLLRLGGDVNACFGFLDATSNVRVKATPLSMAVYKGYEGMVHLLLEAGAEGPAIGLAIVLGNESVAAILSREFYTGKILPETGYTVLQSACRRKLVNLVRCYLEYNHPSYGSGEHVRDRSVALHELLCIDVSRGDFIKREVHEDVFQIVKLLLQHNANFD
ncbi:hypothetical protein GQ44DRAFT_643135, partial [Phaeosphaeriaceae sp. PMI808]